MTTPAQPVENGNLNNDFQVCLHRLMNFGVTSHPRGTTTKELLNYNISLSDPRNRIINFKARKTSLKYLLGEFIWYLTGSNDPSGILSYAKFWDGIRNSGKMQGYPAGTVNSNYGYRLFGHHEPSLVPDGGEGMSQWNAVAKQLRADPDTRQAIINIHLPADRHDGNKDVACTLTLQFFVRENRLHLIVNMRSNDVILGFTNDVFQFTMLQEMMLLQLKDAMPDLELGAYFHNAGSMHIYDRHFKMAEEILMEDTSYELPMVPMDRCDDEILLGLVTVEMQWRSAGSPKDFDFKSCHSWNMLTPYWQALVLMCFAEDPEAMHDVFGIQEHNEEI